MKVKDIMEKNLCTINHNTIVEEASKIFEENSLSGAPVVNEDGELVGIITPDCLIDKHSNTKVHNIMKTNLTKVNPDDTLSNIVKDYRFRYYIAVDNNQQVIGIITPFEFTKALQYLDHTLMNQSIILDELYLIIDNLYNPIIAVDNKGNITIFNSAAEKKLSIYKNDAIGKNIKDLFHDSTLLDIIDSGEIQKTKKISFNNKTFISNKTPILHDGQIIGAAAILQDITDLESISKELNYTKMLKSQLDVIFESSFDAIWVTDGKGKILRVSSSIRDLLGMPVEDIIGKQANELIHHGLHSRSIIMRCIECKEVLTGTTVSHTGRDVLVTSKPIINEEGNVSLVVSNIRDISELKFLEHRVTEAEKLNQIYRYELEKYKIKKQVVYRSAKMQNIMNQVIRLAKFDCTVLIQGETGVGKEVIANTIHENSMRKNMPFIKVNCGAIPENLLESELFGYEKGAFTGADKNGKAGMFEMANNGTILLDEIGELPLSLQVKLLRAVQEKQITRVGGTKKISLNIRILSATNRDLKKMMLSKEFRSDLYYRLNVASINIPPLRERSEDILPLIKHFLQVINEKYETNKKITSSALNKLIEFNWPGNIRELENVVERLVVLTEEDIITTYDLPKWIMPDEDIENDNLEIIPLKIAINKVERQILEKVFKQYDSTRKMAEALDIHQSTLLRKAAKYGLKSKYKLKTESCDMQ